MRAIAIKYNGGDDTRILFKQEVSGKLLQIQKYLMNAATEKDTDPIFAERGTDLIKTALAGSLVSTVNANDDGFAGVDTLYFCNYEEAPIVYASGDNVINFVLSPMDYDASTTSLSFNAEFTFKDYTETSTNLTIADNG